MKRTVIHCDGCKKRLNVKRLVSLTVQQVERHYCGHDCFLNGLIFGFPKWFNRPFPMPEIDDDTTNL